MLLASNKITVCLLALVQSQVIFSKPEMTNGLQLSKKLLAQQQDNNAQPCAFQQGNCQYYEYEAGIFMKEYGNNEDKLMDRSLARRIVRVFLTDNFRKPSWLKSAIFDRYSQKIPKSKQRAQPLSAFMAKIDRALDQVVLWREDKDGGESDDKYAKSHKIKDENSNCLLKKKTARKSPTAAAVRDQSCTHLDGIEDPG